MQSLQPILLQGLLRGGTAIDESVGLALAIAINDIPLVEQSQRYGLLLKSDTVLNGVPEI